MEQELTLKEILKEIFEIIVIAAILATIMRTTVIEARVIPSGSMIPTIQISDRVLVNKFLYYFKQPQRGDIIVFKPPEKLAQKDDFIKRVIGLPGDTVEVHDGRVFVNGDALTEPYIAEPPAYSYGPIKVPQGCLFVMGDNRNQSFDSHLWESGVWLKLDHVKGKAFAIFWPLNRAEMLN